MTACTYPTRPRPAHIPPALLALSPLPAQSGTWWACVLAMHACTMAAAGTTRQRAAAVICMHACRPSITHLPIPEGIHVHALECSCSSASAAACHAMLLAPRPLPPHRPRRRSVRRRSAAASLHGMRLHHCTARRGCRQLHALYAHSGRVGSGRRHSNGAAGPLGLGLLPCSHTTPYARH